jgi:hypothetical protein
MTTAGSRYVSPETMGKLRAECSSLQLRMRDLPEGFVQRIVFGIVSISVNTAMMLQVGPYGSAPNESQADDDLLK